jgi:Carboxypeptidase regulatory-like domain
MREKSAQGKREFSLRSFSLLLSIFFLLFVGLAGTKAFAQGTTATGSISGTVTDPTGAVVPKAKVSITNAATGLEVRLTASSAGLYNSGPLLPAEYVVTVQAEGFKTSKVTKVVQVGTVTTADVKLEVGTARTVVEVSGGGPIQVNTSQATVQGVLTRNEIENLPVNGRNFLDLATMEPGVQIQDGATFDPTKNGYSSVSFGGRAGRTARIEVDGIDISDETVGTTTQNIPQSAIQEFQVAQSTLSASTELTSSGTINVTTRSGTNGLHGGGFFYGRSNQLSAKIAPVQPDFARKQYGADLGGPFIRNKLFFFGDWERTQQDLFIPVTAAPPFTAFSGTYDSPFRDTMFLGRLDYKVKPNASLFYRFSYEQNTSVRPFGAVPGSWQPFANKDHTPVHVAGFDFTQGRFTHSFRFGYTKFHNQIVDGTSQAGADLFNFTPGIELSASPFSFDAYCLFGFEYFCTGANILAPQVTFQRDTQGKYDGTFTFGSHTLQYGIAVNLIKGGGFASFFSLAPGVGIVPDATTIAGAAMVSCTSGQPNCPVANQPFVCPNGATGAACQLNYPVNTVIVSNGQGFANNAPAFGYPGGGQFDTRLEWYLGDSWRARHNLTINYALRYVRDTGRSDNNYPPIPCSAPGTTEVLGVSCTGNILDQVQPGLGAVPRQPNNNFAPQLGIAWDPTGSGKTVIRAGGGLYYENAIFNNVLFDPAKRLPTGLLLATPQACSGGAPSPVSTPSGQLNPDFCGKILGGVVSDIVGFQQAYQSAVGSTGSTNETYFPNSGCAGTCDGVLMLPPNYQTPYSWQMNVGIQHEFGHGNVLTVDFVRNIGEHYLVGIDVNHVGDARYFDKSAALAAISATNNSFGCGTGTSSASIDCAITNGASIFDYAGNGMDGGTELCGGLPASLCGVNLAFPGKNPLFGEVQVARSIGRSTYDGLLVSWKSNLNHPLPAFEHMALIVTYALSRFNSMSNDQDFLPTATDYLQPLKYVGPSALDRTSNLGVSAVINFPAATQVSMITHWATAPPLTLTFPTAGLADIYTNDVTGDGTVGDPLPGTNIGAYGRSIKQGDLAGVISNWNSNGANKLTPAGQVLVSQGLFSTTQLSELGAVTPALPAPVPGQVGPVGSFDTDLQISWLLRPSKLWSNVPESLTIEPQVAIYNLFNYQNFSNTISGILSSGSGNICCTTRQSRTDLVTPGAASGVNWYNVPRQAQFGVKITF